MLQSIFSLCRRGESCPKTYKEDYERIHKLLKTNKYDVSHYPSTHPLYLVYENYLIDNRLFISEKICRGKLPEEYIINDIQLEYSPILSILRIKDSVGNIKIKGFAQFDINENEVYIFTFCTAENKDSLGTTLMQSIITYAKTISSITSIKLNSIPNAKNFYNKMGFKPYGSDSKMIKQVGGSTRKKRNNKTLQRYHNRLHSLR